MSSNQADNSHTLVGLDGANPLGFLAALGTLHTAADIWDDPALHWTVQEGGWVPVLSLPKAIDAKALAEVLHNALQSRAPTPAFQLADNLTITLADFGKSAHHAQCQALEGARRYADFIGAFGSEVTENPNKAGTIADTALRTMSGAGHQHFLKSMRELESATTAADIHKSLFAPWAYDDPKPTMRWDVADDRRYALRWRDPSTDEITTMRGANRLAIEAMPLLPTMPQATGLATTGFSIRSNRRIEWTWPIWDAPIPMDVCRSLLSLDELQASQPPVERLRPRGIAAAYRSRRITIGQYRNFTPAEAVA